MYLHILIVEYYLLIEIYYRKYVVVMKYEILFN